MSGRVGSITTDIIADGLVFNMDAANRASTIPSTGTNKAFNTINLSETGSFINDTAYDPSTISPSYVFDGIEDYIMVTPISLGTEQTISFWMYRINNAAAPYENQHAPIADTNSGWVGNRIYLNNAVLYFRVGTTVVNFGSIIGSTYDAWNQICLTRKDGLTSAYINGVFNNTQTIADSTGTVGVDSIGGNSLYDDYMYGNMGPIHIYNRALSSTEVLHNYNALKGRFGL